MRKLSMMLFCAAVISAGTLSASTTDKPGRVVSALVKRALIVEAVDAEKRELRVLDSEGNRFSLAVDPVVAKFDAIEPRDRIVAEYVESVALIIAPPGSEPLLGDAGAVEVDPQSDKPSIRAAETRLVTATIDAINMTDRLVTITTEQGDTRDLKVAEDARLDMVDVGDQVRLRISVAVMVSVTEPDS